LRMTEALTYVQLGERLEVSAQAARARGHASSTAAMLPVSGWEARQRHSLARRGAS
jgi:hypothetical protein